MSEQNIEEVRSGYEQFVETGEFDAESATEDFVWDMSHFAGWPEQQLYVGAAGARRFLQNWGGAWDDWRLEVEELHDAGDRVVAIMRQQGRSKTTGLTVDMVFAMVWTMREGKRSRMDMYSDPGEALRTAGLDPPV